MFAASRQRDEPRRSPSYIEPGAANAPPRRLLLYGGGLPALVGRFVSHMTVTCLLHLANASSRDGRPHRTSSAVLSLPPPIAVPFIGEGGLHLHVCCIQYVTGCSRAAAFHHQARFPLVARQCCVVGSSLAEPPLFAFIVVCRHPGARVDLLDPCTAWCEVVSPFEGSGKLVHPRG